MDASEGKAIVRLQVPSKSSDGVADARLTAQLRTHAADLSELVARLESLTAAGWALRYTAFGEVHAERDFASGREAIEDISGYLPPGGAVDWHTAGLPTGGFIVGDETSHELMPGDIVPAVSWSRLTGNQRVAESVAGLRADVMTQLYEMARWWAEHPQGSRESDAMEARRGLVLAARELEDPAVPLPARIELHARPTRPPNAATVLQVLPCSWLAWLGYRAATVDADQAGATRWTGEAARYTREGRQRALRARRV